MGVFGQQSEDEKEPRSETTESIDDILGGFDEAPLELESPSAEAPSDGLHAAGRLSLASTYNYAHDAPAQGQTDWRGLSRLRLRSDLELRAQPGKHWNLLLSGHAFYDFAFAIQGRDMYTPEVLDSLEHELELDESFIRFDPSPGVSFSVGRQVVAWGNSETTRVTDILNPLDLREPGLTDLEDLRLPVNMSRFQLVRGAWTADLMAIHEFRAPKYPPYGHDFNPLPLRPPSDELPASSWDNTEYAASLRGHFQGWDLSLYWAELWDDQTHLSQPELWDFVLRHSRIHMLGAAWDMTAGSWLLKAEAAHLRGLEFYNVAGRDFNRSDLMLGLEYVSSTDLSLTVEAVVRSLHDYDAELRDPPDLSRKSASEWVLRCSQLLLHQTLSLNLVALMYGSGGGSMERLEARYDLSDHLELAAGVVLYQSGDNPLLVGIDDNDRLFTEISYRF